MSSSSISFRVLSMSALQTSCSRPEDVVGLATSVSSADGIMAKWASCSAVSCCSSDICNRCEIRLSCEFHKHLLGFYDSHSLAPW